MSPYLLSAVLIGGMVAGILDIGAAAAINRTGPVAILRVIASGLLGPKALKGGTLAAGLGFLLQLAMSIVIAAIYGLASLWLPILARIRRFRGYDLCRRAAFSRTQSSAPGNFEDHQRPAGYARFWPDRRLRRTSSAVLEGRQGFARKPAIRFILGFPENPTYKVDRHHFPTGVDRVIAETSASAPRRADRWRSSRPSRGGNSLKLSNQCTRRGIRRMRG